MADPKARARMVAKQNGGSQRGSGRGASTREELSIEMDPELADVDDIVVGDVTEDAGTAGAGAREGQPVSSQQDPSQEDRFERDMLEPDEDDEVMAHMKSSSSQRPNSEQARENMRYPASTAFSISHISSLLGGF